MNNKLLAVFVLALAVSCKKSNPENLQGIELEDRMEILENRMDINRAMMEQLRLDMDSLQKIKNTHETKIIRIRNNRGANNELISAMSSAELTSALANRYKDSIK